MKKSILVFAMLALLLCLAVGCTRRTADDALPPPAAAPETQNPDAQTPAAPAEGPLSAEELAYFNETFFNGEGFNIRNQFLSSAYERPEDIDLAWLFYDGTGLPAEVDEAERQAVVRAGFDGEDPEVDLTKCPAGDIDKVLLENTGLTLAQTNQTGLDACTYLPEYDAYYHFHGDTNYRPRVVIAAGERKDGLIRLYYEDDFFADGWKRVKLRETGDGGCQFVANGSCDPADVPNT